MVSGRAATRAATDFCKASAQQPLYLGKAGASRAEMGECMRIGKYRPTGTTVPVDPSVHKKKGTTNFWIGLWFWSNSNQWLTSGLPGSSKILILLDINLAIFRFLGVPATRWVRCSLTTFRQDAEQLGSSDHHWPSGRSGTSRP